MDRGEVVDHVVTEVSEIQICHLDLADPGNPCLFVTACEPKWKDGRPVDLADTPNIFFDQAEWPQFLRPEQLDEFIEKLQAQRAWLAETDPAKRYEMVNGEPPDWAE